MLFPSSSVFGVTWTEHGEVGEEKRENPTLPWAWPQNQKPNKTPQTSPRRSCEHSQEARGAFHPLWAWVCSAETKYISETTAAGKPGAANLAV